MHYCRRVVGCAVSLITRMAQSGGDAARRLDAGRAYDEVPRGERGERAEARQPVPGKDSPKWLTDARSNAQLCKEVAQELQTIRKQMRLSPRGKPATSPQAVGSPAVAVDDLPPWRPCSRSPLARAMMDRMEMDDIMKKKQRGRSRSRSRSRSPRGDKHRAVGEFDGNEFPGPDLRVATYAAFTEANSRSLPAHSPAATSVSRRTGSGHAQSSQHSVSNRSVSRSKRSGRDRSHSSSGKRRGARHRKRSGSPRGSRGGRDRSSDRRQFAAHSPQHREAQAGKGALSSSVGAGSVGGASHRRSTLSDSDSENERRPHKPAIQKTDGRYLTAGGYGSRRHSVSSVASSDDGGRKGGPPVAVVLQPASGRPPSHAHSHTHSHAASASHGHSQRRSDDAASHSTVASGVRGRREEGSVVGSLQGNREQVSLI